MVLSREILTCGLALIGSGRTDVGIGGAAAGLAVGAVGKDLEVFVLAAGVALIVRARHRPPIDILFGPPNLEGAPAGVAAQKAVNPGKDKTCKKHHSGN